MVLCISFVAAQGGLPVEGGRLVNRKVDSVRSAGKDLRSSPVFPHTVLFMSREHEAAHFCLVFWLNVAIFGAGFLLCHLNPERWRAYE